MGGKSGSPSVATLRRLLKPFSRVGLASLPTPLEPLKRLSKEIDGPKIWVKREDMTGLGFGGNKLRCSQSVCLSKAAGRIFMVGCQPWVVWGKDFVVVLFQYATDKRHHPPPISQIRKFRATGRKH